MTTVGYGRAKEIFLAACDLPRSERRRFLATACDGDDGLRRTVEDLLEHDPKSDSEADGVCFDVIPGFGDKYEALRRVGCGGMGDVWEAEQLEPVRRRVALKLIRAGITGKEVLVRFEAERQALAMMNHKNIATVFEAGETGCGRPFFAMEFIRGVPITEHCDTHRLDFRERLRLFAEVCEGVQHAHQRGVIHRDIKPSNVLVTDDDGHPTPKIIDFGVAKATSLRLTDRTLFTEQGQWIGTPEYMSPEQAGLADCEVDTRTDVYALGVLLYELLVGTQPFPADVLRSAGLVEMCRMLREEDPPRPSTRVSTRGEHTDVVASKRRTDGATLTRLLRGDLDWVVMKALEKDRNRRYSSAADFAADVHRFLSNEPVRARPPSTLYRAGKFVSRNRTVVGAGAAVLLALIIAVISTTIGMVRAHREAEAARSVAESMAAVLETLNPAASDSYLHSARRALNQGAEVIEKQLADQPLVRARLMMLMGQTYNNLGMYDKAGILLDDALAVARAELEEGDPTLGELYFSLAWSNYLRGHFEAARSLFERSLAVFEQGLGAEDIWTAWALACLGNCQWRIGEYRQSQRSLDEAERIITRTEGPDSDFVASLLEFKGILSMTLGELEQSKEELRRSLAIHERWLGRDHTGVVASLTNLARVHLLLGEAEPAERLLQRAHEISLRAFGVDDLSLVEPLRLLAAVASDNGDHERARRLFQRALEIGERSLAKDHPDLAWTLRPYGRALRRCKDYEGSRELLDRALAIVECAFGPRHFEVALTLGAIAHLEYELEHLEQALAFYERVEEILRDVFPANHSLIGINFYQQACITARLGDRANAMKLLNRALATDWLSDVVLEDPDLDSLRCDPEFKTIITRVKDRLDSDLPDPYPSPSHG